MGQRGPRPTPTKVLEMRGSWRAKTRPQEPQPPQRMKATPPTWLSAQAKQHWKATAPPLLELGLLTILDEHAWGMACEMWARAMELNHLIRTQGTVLQTELGPRLHPALRAQQQAFELYHRLTKEFGSTPAARATLGMSTPVVDGGTNGKATTDKSRFFRSKDGEGR